MAASFRIFTKRVLLICNAVLLFFFILSCLAPYLHPRSWWPVSLLGLLFPALLLLNLAFIGFWFFVLKPRYALISGLGLLPALPAMLVTLAFHTPRTFQQEKDSNNVRVVCWNVARFVELKRNNNKGSMARLEMLKLLKKQNADVLCLQEFHTSTDSTYYDNIGPIQQELGYPYYYFSFDLDGDNHYYSSIIFSRLPIIDSGKIRFPRPTLPEVLLFADLLYQGDTIRVYNTHLQSLQLGRFDYDRMRKIRNADDSMVANSRTILGKLRKGLIRRSIQAEVTREIMGNSPHPYLLCADLNDVPNSYTYRKVRGPMQDAFLSKGFGIGRTFSRLSPTLRIDYIFADRNFKIHQFKREARILSDHYMLVADVSLKK